MFKFTSRHRAAFVATIIAVLGLAPAVPAHAWNPQPDPPAAHAAMR